MENYF